MPFPRIATSGKRFVSVWKTDNAGTSNADQIALPLESSGTYNFLVQWGDGTSSKITAWNQAEVTHTYPVAGTYTVRIKGTIIGFRFNNGGDKLKLLDISNWGCLRVGNNSNYFCGCANLTGTAVDALDLTGTTNMDSMFNSCWLFNQPLPFDTTNITSMAYMLYNCWSFNQNIGTFTVTALTNAASMLREVTLSTANYDALLVGWEAQAVQNNVPFHGGNSKYSAGAPATARAALIADHGWTITDGGPA